MIKLVLLMISSFVLFNSCKTEIQESVLYEELTPSVFRQRLAEKPVAYLPLGTLEYHGEHLPLGTDALHSKGFFTYMAREKGGIVMPLIAMGPSWFTGKPIDSLISIHCTPSPKTGSCYWIPDSVYHTLLDNQFSLLARTGFKVVVVHGHAPSVIYVERHFKQWEDKYDIHIIPYFIYRDNGDLGYSGHAGVNETSLMMYYYPELVSIDSITSDASVTPYGIQGINPRSIASIQIAKDMEARHIVILSDRIEAILSRKLK
ncbi:creatininase family protein [Bacteroidota bacterium]